MENKQCLQPPTNYTNILYNYTNNSAWYANNYILMGL